MERSRRKFALDIFGLLCSLFFVALSASTTPLQYNTPRLIALIAGSFGAGVTLANALRDRPARRARERQAAAAIEGVDVPDKEREQ